MGCQRVSGVLLVAACALVAAASATTVEDLFEAASLLNTPAGPDFVPLAMIELEEHEDTPTPPFSVCKYLLETSAQHVKKGDHWPLVAKHIARVRQSLPEHVRSACDAFIKHNTEDIMSMLQLSVEQDDMTAALEAVAQAADDSAPSASGSSSASGASQTPAESQQEIFKKFWEEKGKYCGACLTMTKKIQKWLSLNCTQGVIADRVIRMCGTMPPELKAQCESNRIWIQEYVLKQLFNKFPLPNHCAYLGLCEKTMVIRALQNPLVMADAQNALIEDLEGTNPNGVQEGQPVLQRAHETPNTAPEITFDLTDGGVSYRDVDRSLGEGLPKVYMDGSHDPTDLRGDAFSLLETEESAQQFDLTNPTEPRVLVHAQEENNINVPVMHVDLMEKGATKASKTYKFQENHLPIETKWLKGCAACQFTIGSLFEFMSNPRAIKSLLPSIKRSCQSCNSPEEIVKCEEFVENHGVAFYQDVVRQGSPSKWCPRLELCEIQYFYPSPHVLADTYGRLKDKITAVGDF